MWVVCDVIINLGVLPTLVISLLTRICSTGSRLGTRDAVIIQYFNFIILPFSFLESLPHQSQRLTNVPPIPRDVRSLSLYEIPLSLVYTVYDVSPVQITFNS